MSSQNKPFVLFRTKQELLQSKVQGQLEFGEGVENELKNHDPQEVLGVTVRVASPPTVVEVKKVGDMASFSELAF